MIVEFVDTTVKEIFHGKSKLDRAAGDHDFLLGS